MVKALLATLDVLLDLFETGEALALEVSELLDGLSQHALLKEVVHYLLVVLGRVEPRERLQSIDDLAVLL